MTHEVVVVGAGVGGLTCAALLAARGVDVCVLERESQGGGTAGAFERFGYSFETTAGLYAGWGAAEIHARVFAELPVAQPEARRLAPAYVVRLLNSSAAARYTIVVMATLTAPLVEEVVYRGVLYPALQRRVGMLWGVAGVMMIFALIHVPQYYPSFGAISTIGVLSLSLTLLRAYSGRLLPCVVVHTIFNGLASVAILLEPYFKDVPTVTDEPTTSAALLPHVTHAAAQLVSIFF